MIKIIIMIFSYKYILKKVYKEFKLLIVYNNIKIQILKLGLKKKIKIIYICIVKYLK